MPSPAEVPYLRRVERATTPEPEPKPNDLLQRVDALLGDLNDEPPPGDESEASSEGTRE
jgi:hypothetical protein